MDNIELKKLYEKKSDQDLFNVLESREDYTKETIKIVEHIIEERGGYKKLKEEIELQLNKENEIEELNRVSKFLLNKGADIDEIKEKVKCKFLNESEIDSLLQDFRDEFNTETVDKEVSAKSILSGIIGGGIGSILGGALWGLMMIKSGQIFYIFAIGLFLLSYFFVWLFSRKSMDNKGTIVISIISVLLAMVIGQLLLEIYGMEEYVN